jgi:hypothetical protein
MSLSACGARRKQKPLAPYKTRCKGREAIYPISASRGTTLIATATSTVAAASTAVCGVMCDLSWLCVAWQPATQPTCYDVGSFLRSITRERVRRRSTMPDLAPFVRLAGRDRAATLLIQRVPRACVTEDYIELVSRLSSVAASNLPTLSADTRKSPGRFCGPGGPRGSSLPGRQVACRRDRPFRDTVAAWRHT